MAMKIRLRRLMLVMLGRKALLAAALAALLMGGPWATHGAEKQNDTILVTGIKGAIGVATSRLVADALIKARALNARYLLIRLDTPGGLVSSTRDIIQHILTSPIPVIVYVSPGGARAASAGTFIVYAAHIAAMAPGTNLGAATPIELEMPGLPRPTEPKGGKESGKEREVGEKDKTPTETAAQRKALNDTIAMLRSLAQLRGRNIKWAENAIRDAATLTAQEAQKQGVIDIVARNDDDLLSQINGRTVTIDNTKVAINTNGLTPVEFKPDWRIRILGAISDPNIAFILLLVGIYGLLFEFWHPGGIVAGVFGAIALLLALMALTTLPVQYAALGLVVLGIALMIGEAFTPGFGVLGIGGLLAFVIGALFLFDPAASDIDISVSLPLIVAAAAACATVTMFVFGAALQARRRPVMTGSEEMIGMIGEVVEWDGIKGRVRVHGEIWSACADQPLNRGDPVRVVRRDRLTLFVKST